MSTVKVDTISNGAAEVNFNSNVDVGTGTVLKEVYSQSTAPSTTLNGALWWDTSSSSLKVYLNGDWAQITLV